MTKRLADGTVKTLAASLFTSDAPTIESYLEGKHRLLRLTTPSTLKTALNDKTNIALLMFDLDGTLVRTKSGKLFAKDASDWTWLYPDGIKRIRDSASARSDALCVVVSNQAGKTPIDVVQERIRQVMVAMKIPMVAMAALNKDQYRKPDIGIWEHLLDYLRNQFQIGVDQDACLFVGDAAGRLQSGPDAKPDFSYTDRAFACNAGVRFQTPEEYFKGEPPAAFTMPDPERFLRGACESFDGVLDKIKVVDGSKVEILLLVGWPGCGKSTFCAKHLTEYVVISQDQLKSHSKCIKLGLQALNQGKSICIDNTNYRKATRLHWVQLSQRPEIACPIRVLQFDVDRTLAEHMNCVRHARAVRLGEYDRKIPAVAYHTFAKHYVAPSLDEGYEDVITVPFVPAFQSEQDQILFKRIY